MRRSVDPQSTSSDPRSSNPGAHELSARVRHAATRGTGESRQSRAASRRHPSVPHADGPNSVDSTSKPPSHPHGKNPYGRLLDHIDHPFRESWPFSTGAPSQVGSSIAGRPRTSGLKFTTRASLPPESDQVPVAADERPPSPPLVPQRQPPKSVSVKAAKNFFESKASQNQHGVSPLPPRFRPIPKGDQSSKPQPSSTATRRKSRDAAAVPIPEPITPVPVKADAESTLHTDVRRSSPFVRRKTETTAQRLNGSVDDVPTKRMVTEESNRSVDNSATRPSVKRQSTRKAILAAEKKASAALDCLEQSGRARRQGTDREVPITSSKRHQRESSDRHSKSRSQSKGDGDYEVGEQLDQRASKRRSRRQSSHSAPAEVDDVPFEPRQLQTKSQTANVESCFKATAHDFGEPAAPDNTGEDIAAKNLSHDGSGSTASFSRRVSAPAAVPTMNVGIQAGYHEIDIPEHVDWRGGYGRRQTKDFGYPGARIKPRNTFRTYKPLEDPGNWIKRACGHFSHVGAHESREDASRQMCRQCLAKASQFDGPNSKQHRRRQRAATDSSTASSTTSKDFDMCRRSSRRRQHHSDCIPSDRCGDSFAKDLGFVIDAILEEHTNTLQSVINNIKFSQPSLAQLRRVSEDLVQRCKTGEKCKTPYYHCPPPMVCQPYQPCQPVCQYVPPPCPYVPPRAAEPLNVGRPGQLGPNLNDPRSSLQESTKSVPDLVDLVNSAADDLGVDLSRKPSVRDDEKFSKAPVERTPRQSIAQSSTAPLDTVDKKPVEEDQPSEDTWLQQTRRQLTELSEARSHLMDELDSIAEDLGVQLLSPRRSQQIDPLGRLSKTSTRKSSRLRNKSIDSVASEIPRMLNEEISDRRLSRVLSRIKTQSRRVSAITRGLEDVACIPPAEVQGWIDAAQSELPSAIEAIEAVLDTLPDIDFVPEEQGDYEEPYDDVVYIEEPVYGEEEGGEYTPPRRYTEPIIELQQRIQDLERKLRKEALLKTPSERSLERETTDLEDEDVQVPVAQMTEEDEEPSISRVETAESFGDEEIVSGVDEHSLSSPSLGRSEHEAEPETEPEFVEEEEQEVEPQTPARLQSSVTSRKSSYEPERFFSFISPDITPPESQRASFSRKSTRRKSSVLVLLEQEPADVEPISRRVSTAVPSRRSTGAELEAETTPELEDSFEKLDDVPESGSEQDFVPPVTRIREDTLPADEDPSALSDVPSSVTSQELGDSEIVDEAPYLSRKVTRRSTGLVEPDTEESDFIQPVTRQSTSRPSTRQPTRRSTEIEVRQPITRAQSTVSAGSADEEPVYVFDLPTTTPPVFRERLSSIKPFSKAVTEAIVEFSTAGNSSAGGSEQGDDVQPEPIPVSRKPTSRRSSEQVPSPELAPTRISTRRSTQRIPSPEPLVKRVTTRHLTQPAETYISRVPTYEIEEVVLPEPVVRKVTSRRPTETVSPAELLGESTSSVEPVVSRVTTQKVTERVESPGPIIRKVTTQRVTEPVNDVSALPSSVSSPSEASFAPASRKSTARDDAPQETEETEASLISRRETLQRTPTVPISHQTTLRRHSTQPNAIPLPSSTRTSSISSPTPAEPVKNTSTPPSKHSTPSSSEHSLLIPQMRESSPELEMGPTPPRRQSTLRRPSTVSKAISPASSRRPTEPWLPLGRQDSAPDIIDRFVSPRASRQTSVTERKATLERASTLPSRRESEAVSRVTTRRSTVVEIVPSRKSTQPISRRGTQLSAAVTSRQPSVVSRKSSHVSAVDSEEPMPDESVEHSDFEGPPASLARRDRVSTERVEDGNAPVEGEIERVSISDDDLQPEVSRVTPRRSTQSAVIERDISPPTDEEMPPTRKTTRRFTERTSPEREPELISDDNHEEYEPEPPIVRRKTSRKTTGLERKSTELEDKLSARSSFKSYSESPPLPSRRVTTRRPTELELETTPPPIEESIPSSSSSISSVHSDHDLDATIQRQATTEIPSERDSEAEELQDTVASRKPSLGITSTAPSPTQPVTRIRVVPSDEEAPEVEPEPDDENASEQDDIPPNSPSRLVSRVSTQIPDIGLTPASQRPSIKRYPSSWSTEALNEEPVAQQSSSSSEEEFTPVISRKPSISPRKPSVLSRKATEGIVQSRRSTLRDEIDSAESPTEDIPAKTSRQSTRKSTIPVKRTSVVSSPSISRYTTGLSRHSATYSDAKSDFAPVNRVASRETQPEQEIDGDLNNQSPISSRKSSVQLSRKPTRIHTWEDLVDEPIAERRPEGEDARTEDSGEVDRGTPTDRSPSIHVESTQLESDPAETKPPTTLPSRHTSIATSRHPSIAPSLPIRRDVLDSTEDPEKPTSRKSTIAVSRRSTRVLTERAPSISPEPPVPSSRSTITVNASRQPTRVNAEVEHDSDHDAASSQQDSAPSSILDEPMAAFDIYNATPALPIEEPLQGEASRKPSQTASRRPSVPTEEVVLDHEDPTLPSRTTTRRTSTPITMDDEGTPPIEKVVRVQEEPTAAYSPSLTPILPSRQSTLTQAELELPEEPPLDVENEDVEPTQGVTERQPMPPTEEIPEQEPGRISRPATSDLSREPDSLAPPLEQEEIHDASGPPRKKKTKRVRKHRRRYTDSEVDHRVPKIITVPAEAKPRKDVKPYVPPSKPQDPRRMPYVPPEEQYPQAPVYPVRDTPAWTRPDVYTPPPKPKLEKVFKPRKRTLFGLRSRPKEEPETPEPEYREPPSTLTPEPFRYRPKVEPFRPAAPGMAPGFGSAPGGTLQRPREVRIVPVIQQPRQPVARIATPVVYAPAPPRRPRYRPRYAPAFARKDDYYPRLPPPIPRDEEYGRKTYVPVSAPVRRDIYSTPARQPRREYLPASQPPPRREYASAPPQAIYAQPSRLPRQKYAPRHQASAPSVRREAPRQTHAQPQYRQTQQAPPRIVRPRRRRREEENISEYSSGGDEEEERTRWGRGEEGRIVEESVGALSGEEEEESQRRTNARIEEDDSGTIITTASYDYEVDYSDSNPTTAPTTRTPTSRRPLSERNLRKKRSTITPQKRGQAPKRPATAQATSREPERRPAASRERRRPAGDARSGGANVPSATRQDSVLTPRPDATGSRRRAGAQAETSAPAKPAPEPPSKKTAEPSKSPGWLAGRFGGASRDEHGGGGYGGKAGAERGEGRERGGARAERRDGSGNVSGNAKADGKVTAKAVSGNPGVKGRWGKFW